MIYDIPSTYLPIAHSIVFDTRRGVAHPPTGHDSETYLILSTIGTQFIGEIRL